LPQLAALLDISPNHLSQVINEQLTRNFHDFVNAYRVKEAQQRLLDEPDRTVLDIALDAGFNSKSAFYKVFKQHCNMTPLQFQRENQP
ncbi:MAG: AraC family transcriptional regulator, partial [Chloroflexi bacterium]|nr:AraC family transcriptional regulator [Chloroflexota bacterium]